MTNDGATMQCVSFSRSKQALSTQQSVENTGTGSSGQRKEAKKLCKETPQKMKPPTPQKYRQKMASSSSKHVKVVQIPRMCIISLAVCVGTDTRCDRNTEKLKSVHN